MTKTMVPKKILDMLSEVDLTQEQAMWNCHGTWVMLHKALEKLAAHKKVTFDKPEMIYFDVNKNQTILLVTGHCNDVSEWSYGEATPQNNKNAYPFAMAEKRAKDRVILKLLGFHGDVYSDAEVDEEVQSQLAKQAQRNKTDTSTPEVKNEVVEQTPDEKTPPSQPKDAVEDYEKIINRIKQARFVENREAGQLRLLQERFQKDYEGVIMKLPKEIQQKILKLFTDAENQLKSQIRR
tara:strand:- start:736 stop:1446 length:711 start_codon:yes stop_codon:yes gene_type:complete